MFRMHGVRKLVVVVGCVGVGTASGAASAAVDSETGLDRVNSSGFTYQYQMDVEPNSSADLDGNSAADFLPSSSGVDLNTGVAGAADGLTATYNTFDPGDDDRSFALTGFSTIWDTLAPAAADGYTVEVSLKVLTAQGEEGDTGSVELNAGVSDNTAGDSWLAIGRGGQSWGLGANDSLGTNDNTDGFHAFRIAYSEQSGMWVWRDGILLNPGGASLADGVGTTQTNRLNLGSMASTIGGVVEVDHLRVTKGAYAPIPEPATLTLLSLGMAAVSCRGRRRYDLRRRSARS